MRIFAHIERAIDALLSPVIADGLRNGKNVRFIERAA